MARQSAASSEPRTNYEHGVLPNGASSSAQLVDGAPDGDAEVLVNAKTALVHEHPAGHGRESKHGKPLTLWPLVSLIFFSVSGGPFGNEGAVSAAGPLYALIGFAVAPWLWSSQIALMTVELSTAYPSDAGYSMWVKEAFGKFPGFMIGFCRWCSGVVDNAIYPVLAVDYLLNLFSLMPDDFGFWSIWLARAVLITLLTLLTLRGLRVVGITSMVLNVLVLLPFVVMCIWGAFRAEPRFWLQRHDDIEWSLFVNVIIWNLNSWDSVSTFADEVQDPVRTYPRAMGIALLIIILTNMLPILVGTGVAHDWSMWNDGYYTSVASLIGGHALGISIVASAFLSNVSAFLAELAADSYQLLGLAEEGILPAVYSSRTRYDTPWAGIATSFVVMMAVITYPFQTILEIDNGFYCIALLFECAAVVWLRVKRPDLPRPFRIPLGVVGLTIFLLPAMALCCFTIYLTSGPTRIVMAILLAIGCLVFVGMHFAKSRAWCRFHADNEHLLAEHLVPAHLRNHDLAP